MRRRQTTAGRVQHVENLGDGARPHLEPRRQRQAVDGLHGHEQLPVPGADVEDGDDVGMADAGHGLRLARQPRAQLLVDVGALVAHELEGDAALQLRIERGVDDAHAAGAEDVKDSIATHQIAGRQHRRLVAELRRRQGVAGERRDQERVGRGGDDATAARAGVGMRGDVRLRRRGQATFDEVGDQVFIRTGHGPPTRYFSVIG